MLPLQGERAMRGNVCQGQRCVTRCVCFCTVLGGRLNCLTETHDSLITFIYRLGTLKTKSGGRIHGWGYVLAGDIALRVLPVLLSYYLNNDQIVKHLM